MTRKIRVLQLQNSFGASTSDLGEQIIRGLPPERFEVTAGFLRGRPANGEAESQAPRSVYFGFTAAQTKGIQRLRAMWALYRHCKAENYDVVIAHRFKPINIMMALTRWLNVRLYLGVLHGIGEYDRRYRCREARRLITPAWRMVGVSRAVCDDLIAADAGFTADNVCRINNAIDIAAAEQAQLPRDEARRQLGLPLDAEVIGTIGRLVPVKAHVQLIEAFALIAADYPQARVAIIGDGRCREELEAAIERHGLQGRVDLLGARDLALQYVRAFDLFAMPSLSEGLPLALLEAMSGHLPVVGSDIPSLKGILEDCGGRSFPVGQPQALAESLAQMLQMTPEQRAAEGEAGYAYLCRAHAIEDFHAQYRDLIESRLEGSQ